eukprot:13567325-Alexandrium_andersonii.AAC.1
MFRAEYSNVLEGAPGGGGGKGTRITAGPRSRGRIRTQRDDKMHNRFVETCREQTCGSRSFLPSMRSMEI